MVLFLTGFQSAMASKPVVTSTDPQIGEGLSIAGGSYANMSFTLNFDQNVSIVNNEPDIKLYEGDVNGSLVSPDDVWKATSVDASQLMVFGADYDGFTCTFYYDSEKEYTLVIPAGMVKNAAGELNDEIVLVYNKQAVANIATIVPEEGTVESLKSFTMTFPEGYAINEESLDEGNGIYVKKVGSDTELTGTLTTFYDNTVEFELDDEITEAGDYVLYVADNYLYDMGETYDFVPAMQFNYTVEGQAGPGVFEMVSSNPANEGVLQSMWGYSTASFTLTFGENVIIKNNAPAITFTKDGANVDDVEEWHLTIGSNATDAQVWGSDMDGYTASFPVDENATYVLTVPAGVIANAAGDLNEEIVLTFYGSEKAKYGTLEFVGSTPENEGEFNLNDEGKTYVTFDLTFSDAVNIGNQDVVNAVKLYEGEVNGTVIEPEFGNWSASLSSDKKTLSIFSLDEYGEGLMMFQPKEETKYYLVVPANIVVTDKNLGNEEITIVINGPEKKEPQEETENVTANPMDKSTVGSLKDIVITFETEEAVTSNESAGDINVYNKNTGEIVTTATVVAADGLNPNEVKIELGKEITEDGVYVVKVPAGRFLKGDKESLAFELQYKVASVLGISEGVNTINGKNVVVRMTLDGKVVDEPVKGVNILRLSDGTMVKVMVK